MASDTNRFNLVSVRVKIWPNVADVYSVWVSWALSSSSVAVPTFRASSDDTEGPQPHSSTQIGTQRREEGACTFQESLFGPQAGAVDPQGKIRTSLAGLEIMPVGKNLSPELQL